MADLVTLPDVLKRLELDTAPPSGVLADLITKASAAVEGHCGRSFTQATFTELIDGGRENLMVRRPVIASITKILDMAKAQSPEDPEAATSYGFDPERGFVFRTDATLQQPTGAPWGEGRRRWAVTYVGASGGPPEEVKDATIDLVVIRFLRRDPGTTSEKLGDEATEHTNELPREVRRKLYRHRNKAF